MPCFRIDASIFERLPTACFGAVVAKGVDNTAQLPEIAALLERETAAIQGRMDGATLKEHPAILPYRNAFLSLGMNPNKFPCSVEALCKRVLKGARLPQINPIVDLGNAMSLKYILPMGAHDVDKLEDDLVVRLSRPGDHFTPFGEDKEESPDPDEPIYVSGQRVKTRRWIWRQSEDGKIDASSSHVVFPIDGFLDSNKEAVLAAQEELASLLETLFQANVTACLLTPEHPSIAL